VVSAGGEGGGEGGGDQMRTTPPAGRFGAADAQRDRLRALRRARAERLDRALAVLEQGAAFEELASLAEGLEGELDAAAALRVWAAEMPLPREGLVALRAGLRARGARRAWWLGAGGRVLTGSAAAVVAGLLGLGAWALLSGGSQPVPASATAYFEVARRQIHMAASALRRGDPTEAERALAEAQQALASAVAAEASATGEEKTLSGELAAAQREIAALETQVNGLSAQLGTTTTSTSAAGAGTRGSTAPPSSSAPSSLPPPSTTAPHPAPTEPHTTTTITLPRPTTTTTAPSSTTTTPSSSSSTTAPSTTTSSTTTTTGSTTTGSTTSVSGLRRGVVAR
jgi:hypothetical protein